MYHCLNDDSSDVDTADTDADSVDTFRVADAGIDAEYADSWQKWTTSREGRRTSSRSGRQADLSSKKRTSHSWPELWEFAVVVLSAVDTADSDSNRNLTAMNSRRLLLLLTLLSLECSSCGEGPT